jgi:hypothetical protein
MVRNILIIIFTLYFNNVSFSQNSMNQTPFLYDSFVQRIKLVYNEYKKDELSEYKVFGIEHWNLIGSDNFRNINDTDYFRIFIIEKLSDVVNRLPTTYLVDGYNIILIYTGIEDIIKPNPEYLKTLFSVLKGKTKEDDLLINSFDDFTFTLLKKENVNFVLDEWRFPTNDYLVLSEKIVKKKFNLRNRKYPFTVYKYKHQIKYIK